MYIASEHRSKPSIKLSGPCFGQEKSQAGSQVSTAGSQVPGAGVAVGWAVHPGTDTQGAETSPGSERAGVVRRGQDSDV